MDGLIALAGIVARERKRATEKKYSLVSRGYSLEMYLYLLIMSSIGRLPIEIRYYQQVYIIIISVNGGHGYHITCCSNK